MNREKQMLRILYCSTALSFGGEQKLITQILSHLDRKHFQPFVGCIRESGYVDQKILGLAAGFLCLGVRSPYNLPGAIQGLHHVIRKHGIDLIHLGIFGSEFSGLLAAMSTGVPAVALLPTTYDPKARIATMGADSVTWHYKWRSYCKWRAFYLLYAILARMAEVHFVALSEAVKESALRHLHLPPDRVTVIPLGLNPEEFSLRLLAPGASGAVKNELGLDGAYPILLNVARLSPVKGQRDLIKAMPRVLERFPRARLLIAGDGALLPQLKKMRDDLGLRREVLLLGRRDDVNVLLRASDLFVFSSYYEGLPGAVIEAMASGRCVVSFDTPSLRSVVEDMRSGVLVQGRDAEKFADTVVDLSEHQDVAQKMGERGLQIVNRKYDIRQNLRRLEALYRQMVRQTSLCRTRKQANV